MNIKCREQQDNRLTELRNRAGLSQGKLSKATGIHVMVISKIERGVTKMENVTLKNAIALADALGVVDLRHMLSEEKRRDQEQKK